MPPKSWGLRSVGAALLLTTLFAGSSAFAASRTYTVRAGDTVSSIAAHFGVSVNALEAANGLGSQGFIRQGQVLSVPGSVSGPQGPGHPAAITVTAGNTLSSLATQYGIPVGQLERWNHLTATSVLQVGERLVLTPPAASIPSRPTPPARPRTAQTKTFTVRPGDTLSSIAAQFHVSIPALASANGLANAGLIQIGQVLRIPGAYTASHTVAVRRVMRVAARKYTVQPGDSLSSIAERTGVAIGTLEALNGLGPNSVLQPGEPLWLSRPAQETHSPRAEASNPPAASVPTSLGSEAVNEAQKFLGVPYVWGGASPAGFDCSGLVQYVFGQIGISLPRTASQQYDVGSAVSRNNLQAGDTVFFDTTGGVSHVGIYIGNGQFIDAPAPGQNVQVMNLNAPYWMGTYIGARSYAGL